MVCYKSCGGCEEKWPVLSGESDTTFMQEDEDIRGAFPRGYRSMLTLIEEDVARNEVCGMQEGSGAGACKLRAWIMYVDK